MKKLTLLKILFYIITIPMAVYLLYRIAATDGLEKTDHLIMLLLFGLLLTKQFILRKEKNSE